MKRTAWVVLTVLLLTGAAPGVAVMRALSTEELTRISDAVVEGDVRSVASYWSADGKAIISRATVVVVDVVRGVAVQKTLTVEYEGGEIDGVGMGVSDMATVAPGQRVLMFLQKQNAARDAGPYEIIGRAQGLYRVGKDRIARKSGFSLLPGGGVPIDNDLDVDLLKEKVRGVR